jgi:hypothetical protein
VKEKRAPWKYNHPHVAIDYITTDFGHRINRLSLEGKYTLALRVPHTTILGKINKKSKKVQKNQTFLGIKDDQVLYLKKNISLQNHFYCMLGKKNKLETLHQ